ARWSSWRGAKTRVPEPARPEREPANHEAARLPWRGGGRRGHGRGGTGSAPGKGAGEKRRAEGAHEGRHAAWHFRRYPPLARRLRPEPPLRHVARAAAGRAMLG